LLGVEPFFAGGKSFEPMAIVLHFMKEYLGFVVTLGPSVLGATCSKGVTFAKYSP